MSTFTKTSKRVSLFLDLTYGDKTNPTVLRICNASSNQVVDGNTYLSEPSVELELSEDTGGLEEKPCTIKLPRNRGVHASIDSFVESVSSISPFSPIDVLAFEIHKISEPGPSEDDESRTYLKEGAVNISRRNPNKNTELIELEFVPTKAQATGIKAGIQATAQCTNTFGKEGCYIDNTGFYPGSIGGWQFGQVLRMYVELRMWDAVGSNPANYRTQIVELTPSSSRHVGIPANAISGQDIGWWLGGHLLKDGLTVPIRDWLWDAGLNQGTDLFVLGKVPPLSWDFVQSGEEVVLVVGCLNTIAACRQRPAGGVTSPGSIGNEGNFNGAGFGMPAYNPMIDEIDRA